MNSSPASIERLRACCRANGRSGLFVGSIVVCLGLAGLILSPPLGGLRGLSYDLLSLTGMLLRSFPPSKEVIIVDVDEESGRALKQPANLVWDGALHARLIDQLTASRAQAVVFVLPMDRPGTNSQELVRAAAANGHVLVGIASTARAGEPGDAGSVGGLPFMALRSVVAWGVVEGGRGGSGPRQHLDGDNATSSLASRVAEVTLPGFHLDAAGQRWFNFYGPRQSLPRVSYADVLSADFPRAIFSNKVVFVGPLSRADLEASGTAAAGSWSNRNEMEQFSTVELCATAYLNLARQDWQSELPLGVQFLLVIVFGGLAGFGLVLARPGLALGASLAVLILGLLLTMAAAWWGHVWFAWLVVAAVQLPAALVGSLLNRVRVLYQQAAEEWPGLPLGRRRRLSLIAFFKNATARQRELVSAGDQGENEAVPVSIPNHQLLHCIGRGAYGEVWLARDLGGAYRAVKIVRLESFGDRGPFDREFRGIQQYTPLSRTHHGLVRVLHVERNREEGYFFYVMELGDCDLHGQRVEPEQYVARTLARELDHHRRLPVKECVHLALELAEALQYLHSRQLIHRDIKPSNIIFVNGMPKFADIGLVTHMAEQVRDLPDIGTIGFIPPEGPGTAAGDVYSLGKMLYEACTGQAADSASGQESEPLENSNEELAQLLGIILKACAAKPKERYQSAAELQAALMQLNDRLLGGHQRVHHG